MVFTCTHEASIFYHEPNALHAQGGHNAKYHNYCINDNVYIAVRISCTSGE